MTEAETRVERIPPDNNISDNSEEVTMVSMVVESGSSLETTANECLPEEDISDMEVNKPILKTECKDEILEYVSPKKEYMAMEEESHESHSTFTGQNESQQLLSSNPPDIVDRVKTESVSPPHSDIAQTHTNENFDIKVEERSNNILSDIPIKESLEDSIISDDHIIHNHNNGHEFISNIEDNSAGLNIDNSVTVSSIHPDVEESIHSNVETQAEIHSVQESDVHSMEPIEEEAQHSFNVSESQSLSVHNSESHSVQDDSSVVFQNVTLANPSHLVSSEVSAPHQVVCNSTQLITTSAQMTPVVTTDQSVQTFPQQSLLSSQSNMLKTVVENTIDTDLSTMPLPNAVTRKTTVKVERAPQLVLQNHHHQINSDITGGQVLITQPPQTDILLQTARQVLQLGDDVPVGDVKNFTAEELSHLMIGQPVSVGGEHAQEQQTHIISSALNSNGVVVTNSLGQRISLDDDNIQQMEVSDENATYVLEPVTNEEYYQDDQNIMWIQETVEVEQESYENLPSMVIILNPNGTVNEELMLAHGMNQETIKALTDNVNLGGIQTVLDPATSTQHQQQEQILPNTMSIKNLQHPIPKKDLHDVKPLFATSQAPRTVMESVLHDSKPIMTMSGNSMQMSGLRSIVESPMPVTEHCRSVILDAKDNYLVLEQDPAGSSLINSVELGHQLGDHHQQPTHRIININGQQTLVPADLQTKRLLGQQVISSNSGLVSAHLGGVNKQDNVHLYLQGQHPTTSLPMTPLGTLDLSLPKKPDSSVLNQLVNPAALVSENSVLKALSNPLAGGKVIRTNGQKIRKPKARDENGNGTPYIHRKTTSLGALGQALHGIPRDSRENAVQICPICKWQATTKNPYRHLQDHLARIHFKERIAAELPTKKPYICPMADCDGKHYPDWQAVMRHYIGKKHGILDKFVKEELSQIRRENGGRIPGTIIKQGMELLGI